jgi:N-acetylmuramoyl-L-alanine amidase
MSQARANHKTCRFGHPTTDTILISIHVNAAGSDGKWHTATGWSAYTFPGHTESDSLADCLYRAAEKYLPGRKLRTDYSDGDPDLEEPFYILKHTYCPAVLTENGFMDSRESLRFLESPEGKKAIVALHVAGIIEYLESS